MKETELDPREKCCCFTGHRPEKLGPHEDFALNITHAVYKATNAGFTTFITGGAKGADIVAAEEVLLIRERINSAVKLVIALPYPAFGQRFERDWRLRFDRAVDQADVVVPVSQMCSMAAYQRRNEWMVDHSGLVITIYNGNSGGTRNTLRYAQKSGIPIWVCHNKLDESDMEKEEDVNFILLRSSELPECDPGFPLDI